MALTKRTVVDQILVDEDAVLSIRTATVIEEDGVEMSRKFHRTTLAPGSDISGEPPRIRKIANAVWDADVVSAFTAKRNRQRGA